MLDEQKVVFLLKCYLSLILSNTLVTTIQVDCIKGRNIYSVIDLVIESVSYKVVRDVKVWKIRLCGINEHKARIRQDYVFNLLTLLKE